MSPRYGSRLMPTVVDEIAREQPNLPYASVALTSRINDGFKDITFSDVALATNYVAGWIDRTLGRSANFDTIAYMGPGDLRYVVVFLAAVKCGYKVLLPSLRNSPWMNASLLEQTKCSHLFHAAEIEGLVRPLVERQESLQLHPIESLDTLIHPDTPHYPYEKDFESSRWDPILILHSSGSTGPPRPIEMNHGTFAVGDNDRNLPQVPGRVNQNWSLWDFPQNERFFSPFPAFHLAGFSSMVMLPIYYPHATIVLGPATRPPTGDLVNEIMDHFPLKSIFCPPIIAEQLVQEPGGLEKCKSLNFLLYAGGPLSTAAGEALSKVTDVCQFYGQTETGAIQALVPKREDWASLEWHPKQEAVMEPSIDGTFEMIMHRNPALVGVRNVSCNFPNVEVWRTKDLFMPHPTKPGLWKFHGRADDIIVLSNGEKFNPVPSETQIAAHPKVSGALIIGQGHPQAALVLELKDYSQDPISVIEEVWPTVEKANAEAPGQAKITRDMVIVGTEDKPFDRAAKGTVIRKSSGDKYHEQVAKLFVQNGSTQIHNIQLGEVLDAQTVSKFVEEVVASVFPGRAVTDDDDLFVLGLDSLQTTEIISLFKSGLQTGESQRQLPWLTARFIYEHPSINSLASATLAHLDTNFTNGVVEDRATRMSGLVEKYTQGLQHALPLSSRYHVILTGSTGSLGTQILLKLLSDPHVARVICLDRSPNAFDRIVQSLSTWPEPPELDASRILCLQADYSKPDFGLSPTQLADLRDNVKVIIHNAWKVDFNHSLASFEAVHIRGVQNFVNFAASSPNWPRIIFISSISSVGNWTAGVTSNGHSDAHSGIVVPEQIPSSLSVAQPIGYAESKAVAERILANAVELGSIRASIVRVGQIAGPSTEKNGGVWNEHEWFPLLLKTSKAMGKLPNESAFEKVDWVPVDVVATVISDIIDNSKPESLDVFHVVNPSTRRWSELLPTIQKKLGGSAAVSISAWVEELERVDANDKDAVEARPALKILDFFRDMQWSQYIGAGDVTFSTERAQLVSGTLSKLGAVTDEWVAGWMKGWGL